MTLIGTILTINLFASSTPRCIVHAEIITYRVAMNPLSSNDQYPPFGFATIFADTIKSTIGYAGIGYNLEDNLTPSKCTAEDGCGVHIYSGSSCDTIRTQGEHFYDWDFVLTDPWTDEEYTTDKDGKANFQSILNIGTTLVEGRLLIRTFIFPKFIFLPLPNV